MDRIRNEAGFFTLVEAIVTLVIVMIILMLPSINLMHTKDTIETDIFTEQVKTQITLMNQHAVLNGEMSVVEVEPGRDRLVFSVLGNQRSPLNTVIQAPGHIKIYGGYKRYSFRPNSGNITNVERIRYTDGSRTIEFVFQIGSGRFYVREV